MNFKFSLTPRYLWTNEGCDVGFDGPDYDVVVCAFTLGNGRVLTLRFHQAVIDSSHRHLVTDAKEGIYYLQSYAHGWVLSRSLDEFDPAVDVIFADTVNVLLADTVIKNVDELHHVLERNAEASIEEISRRLAPGHWDELVTATAPAANTCYWLHG